MRIDRIDGVFTLGLECCVCQSHRFHHLYVTHEYGHWFQFVRCLGCGQLGKTTFRPLRFLDTEEELTR